MPQQGHTVSKPLDILSGEQVTSIQKGALDVLEHTGVVFHHAVALEILHDAGCKVDKASGLVKFPGDMVEQCLRKCPSSFILKARNPKYNLKLGGPTVYFSSWAGMQCIDLDSSEKMPPTEQELADATRVLDYLSEAHWLGFLYGSLRSDHEHGELGMLDPIYRAAIRARNTEKSSYMAGTHGVVEWGLRIFEVVEATPLVSVAASPPLAFSRDQIANLLHCVEKGIPLKPVSGIALGANAPATLAGGLVQSCAEVISVIVLAQTLKPGIEIIAHNYSQPFDMRSGGVIQGGIERGLLGAAWSQIWRNYSIPNMTIMSSDAKVPDYQCSMEKVMSVTIQALSGSNLINFMGGVYDELIFSPVVAIIDNDVARMVGRLLEGISVNKDTLAIDLIREVGPLPGHFLAKKHTKDMWKHEQLIPDLADRLAHPEWVKQGKKNIVERAREKYAEILATHKPAPLSGEQDREIDKILAGAKKYYQEKGLA